MGRGVQLADALRLFGGVAGVVVPGICLLITQNYGKQQNNGHQMQLSCDHILKSDQQPSWIPLAYWQVNMHDEQEQHKEVVHLWAHIPFDGKLHQTWRKIGSQSQKFESCFCLRSQLWIIR
jgi:hypothetical protein